MKLITPIGSAMLLLAFGIATPAYAQDQHDQDHPTKPQDAKPEDKPKQQTEPAKTPNDQPRPAEKQAKPPKEEQPKPEKPKTTARQQQPDDKDRAKPPQNNEHAKPQQDAAHQQTAQQHGRIPDDKFRASFGREHRFHVGHPEIVGGRPRFSYGGYSFFISEAWPSGWGYDDDVYIIEVNGVYYLLDYAHPGVQLELVIG
jgi:hypothetical protein